MNRPLFRHFVADNHRVATLQLGGEADLVAGLQLVQPGLVGDAKSHRHRRHADAVELAVLDHHLAGRLVDFLYRSVSQRLGPVGSGRRGMLRGGW